MNKKQAGERKRTVTVTLGPKTEKLLEDYRAKLASGPTGMDWTLTDVVAMLLRRGIDSNTMMCPDGKGLPWISEKL
jgi:hypothetical protein